MTPAELEGFISAGGDGLIWRVGMHRDIPMSITEAANAPVSVLLQGEVMMAYLDRTAEYLRIKAKHDAAHAAALRKMGRGRG